MIDARRMECYTAVYNGLEAVKPVAAEVIRRLLRRCWTSAGDVIATGGEDGRTLGRPSHPATMPPMHQRRRLLPVPSRVAAGAQEDVAYFDRSILKDFIARSPWCMVAINSRLRGGFSRKPLSGLPPGTWTTAPSISLMYRLNLRKDERT